MLSQMQTRWALVVGMGMCVALIGACGQQQPAPTTQAAELTLTQDTPEHAVASALLCVRHVLEAATTGDRKLARAYRDQLCTVASKPEIEKAIARSPRVAIMLGDDKIDGYLDNWCSALSYLRQRHRREPTHAHIRNAETRGTAWDGVVKNATGSRSSSFA